MSVKRRRSVQLPSELGAQNAPETGRAGCVNAPFLPKTGQSVSLLVANTAYWLESNISAWSHAKSTRQSQKRIFATLPLKYPVALNNNNNSYSVSLPKCEAYSQCFTLIHSLNHSGESALISPS